VGDAFVCPCCRVRRTTARSGARRTAGRCGGRLGPGGCAVGVARDPGVVSHSAPVRLVVACVRRIGCRLRWRVLFVVQECVRMTAVDSGGLSAEVRAAGPVPAGLQGCASAARAASGRSALWRCAALLLAADALAAVGALAFVLPGGAAVVLRAAARAGADVLLRWSVPAAAGALGAGRTPRAGRTGHDRRHLRTHPRALPAIKDRTRFDNYCTGSWSLWQDVKILLRTVLTVLRTDGS
jgi:hypothetical protein